MHAVIKILLSLSLLLSLFSPSFSLSLSFSPSFLPLSLSLYLSLALSFSLYISVSLLLSLSLLLPVCSLILAYSVDFPSSLSLSLSLSLSILFSLSIYLLPPNSLSRSPRPSIARFALTYSHTHALSLSLSLSHTRTLTQTHALSLSLSLLTYLYLSKLTSYLPGRVVLSSPMDVERRAYRGIGPRGQGGRNKKPDTGNEQEREGNGRDARRKGAVEERPRDIERDWRGVADERVRDTERERARGKSTEQKGDGERRLGSKDEEQRFILRPAVASLTEPRANPIQHFLSPPLALSSLSAFSPPQKRARFDLSSGREREREGTGETHVGVTSGRQRLPRGESGDSAPREGERKRKRELSSHGHPRNDPALLSMIKSQRSALSLRHPPSCDFPSCPPPWVPCSSSYSPFSPHQEGGKGSTNDEKEGKDKEEKGE